MLKKFNKKRNQKGFTLVELIVVIAIVGILGGIAVPRLSGFRDKAAEAADKATAATIAKAAELYAIINNENLPNDSEIAIEALEEADLLDKDLKPQQKDKEFDLKYDEGKKIFYVTYDDPSDEVLYPEDFKPTK